MPVGPTPKELIIRTMQREDLDFVVNLSQELGWTPTRKDIENYWSFEPKGCFVAESKEEVIGSVTTTPYTHFAWVGMMLVHPEWQRRRIGSTLMQTAIRYLKMKGIVTIRLEADPPGVPLYNHLDFVKECDSERWYRRGEALAPIRGVRQAKKADLEKVYALDIQAFGDHRKRILQRFFEDSDFTLIPKTPTEGMLMARTTSHGVVFGPFIAKTPNIAEQLLRAGLNRAGDSTVLVGVPATHENALNLLQRFGFVRRTILSRMYLGKEPKTGDSALEYGIAASATG